MEIAHRAAQIAEDLLHRVGHFLRALGSELPGQIAAQLVGLALGLAEAHLVEQAHGVEADLQRVGHLPEIELQAGQANQPFELPAPQAQAHAAEL